MFAVAVQQQPLKQRLKKKLSAFDEKREEWVMKRKNSHNIASIKDEAIIMLEKLHAIGYKPVLFLGNQTKKKDIKCEILTPRCRLTAYAKEYLQKMGSFYEYLCEGWNQDSTENADGVTINDKEYFTLHLTPCEPPEDANSQKEAITQEQETTGWGGKDHGAGGGKDHGAGGGKDHGAGGGEHLAGGGGEHLAGGGGEHLAGGGGEHLAGGGGEHQGRGSPTEQPRGTSGASEQDQQRCQHRVRQEQRFCWKSKKDKDGVLVPQQTTDFPNPEYKRRKSEEGQS